LLLFSAAGLIALAGCVNAPNEPVSAGTSSAPFPSFASIPPAPGDVRSVEGWNAAVTTSESERAQLLADVAPSTFSLTGTEAFLADQRATIAFNPADVPPADQAARSAAWAAQMRERATPPPRPR